MIIKLDNDPLIIAGKDRAQSILLVLDLSALTLKAYPIDQIDDGDASNEIDGTLSDLKDKNGAATSVPTLVREGRYTLTNGTGSVPANFKTSGRFIVFRK